MTCFLNDSTNSLKSIFHFSLQSFCILILKFYGWKTNKKIHSTKFFPQMLSAQINSTLTVKCSCSLLISLSVPHSQIVLTLWSNSGWNIKPRFPVLFMHILKRSQKTVDTKNTYVIAHTSVLLLWRWGQGLEIVYCKISAAFDSSCYIFNTTLILVVSSEQKARHFKFFATTPSLLFPVLSISLHRTPLPTFFTTTEATQVDTLQSKDILLQRNTINTQLYQHIIQLPCRDIGTDVYWTDGSEVHKLVRCLIFKNVFHTNRRQHLQSILFSFKLLWGSRTPA